MSGKGWVFHSTRSQSPAMHVRRRRAQRARVFVVSDDLLALNKARDTSAVAVTSREHHTFIVTCSLMILNNVHGWLVYLSLLSRTKPFILRLSCLSRRPHSSQNIHQHRPDHPTIVGYRSWGPSKSAILSRTLSKQRTIHSL